jgi:hypothetical protein
MSSEATCAYPIAGKSWKTISLTGHCEFFPATKVDLTCNMEPRSGELDTKPSDAFKSIILIVAGICGFLLLLCCGLFLYCWRRARGNLTSNSDSMANEDKDYDDIRPNNYYYYECVPAQNSRYLSIMNARCRAPELPKRPKVVQTELNDFHQFKKHGEACSVPSCESDSDSYITPETAKEHIFFNKVPVTGRPLTDSEAIKCSGIINEAIKEKHLVSGESLKVSRHRADAPDEQEGNSSSLISETIASESGVKRDRPEIGEFGNVHIEKPQYPWNRNSFWKP